VRGLEQWPPQDTGLVLVAHENGWKLKLSHYTPRRRLGESRYSSYSFLTSALDEGEWSASRLGRALAREKDPRYPLYRRLGGPQSRSGHKDWRKNPLPLPGIEPRTPGRPASSQTLYWLIYPAQWEWIRCSEFKCKGPTHPTREFAFMDTYFYTYTDILLFGYCLKWFLLVTYHTTHH
jgi:hypothetical protein